MTQTIELPEDGAVIQVALSKLKASPRNARKTPHAPSDIEALAASIQAKGMIQPLVVEPERDGEGQPTGCYLVTVGEGRRLAQRLRAKRKLIARNAPVRCILDLSNDPFEVSLDENVTRFAMHPADQFDAFRQLAEAQGLGPYEISSRFGVSVTVVKQRLRLAAVSPRLMALYRAGEMSLDQLMVFTITEDHAHQEQVWESLVFDPEDIARAGAFVTLDPYGTVTVERGFVRNEDAARSAEAAADEEPEPAQASREPHLSAKLVADLTAHRTAALCDQLAQTPAVALATLAHGLAVSAFHRDAASCLEVKIGSVDLSAHAPGIRGTLAGLAIAARHAAWDAELPQDEADLWAHVLGLSTEQQLALLAHCLGLTVNALEYTDRSRQEPSAADRLATALRLDMRTYWSATADSYLGRIPKALVETAVKEGVSERAARSLQGRKKAAMAQAAERLLDGKGWLPPLLCTGLTDEDGDQLQATE